MHELTLTPQDGAQLAPLLTEIAKMYDTIEDAELIRQARVLARSLPTRLVEFLEDFRLGEPSALCVLSGLAVDEELLGPTPEHWRDSQYGSPSFTQEIFFLLCASVLGDVFGWATQQDGRIMHDVLPIKGHENYEIGSNSLQHLSWHTEDAFHPCRGDYVALMCLKNPDAVETTVCDAGDLDWSSLDVAALFEPEFTQMPDNSHQPQNARQSTGDPVVDRLRIRSFELIQSWNDDPVKRPILFGDSLDPYMALDPYHMKTDGWPERSLRAFEALCAEIEAKMRSVRLRPGDLVFIDNFRAVHGRKSFRPRYDGSDRWLKRLNITRNLRGSRGWRPAADHRVIY
ncbi:Fe(II)/alpha-ketoglutarate-dependent arginine beta-hydroxylase [Streptosporangium becharense]|uniref:Fe(II)/alpha-ketoglutarate-dependent arginine beta-hydroxylase n=1 Tax=Streptosporangium becharense TaxID=1816182 RepID=A0A7W9IB35_9ACTN|nr:arginine beta-hydroxylase, Fe(II)/alpha-ketoglutarate-dependent [Streptosporangium becharense]MBB2914099.1 Fe(II)/alpha-ketoglutarate-dependent arginine beta-hydroxylase [Streptosporangium becharense]MBB5817126.1 Fe(II)/alpha-ketoglutarate-dependent arginine beta-hydroxylase [Streptosporangium becharense]